MTRLIDADALNLEYEVDMADDWKTAHEMANIVKYAPTVDAEPERKTGKWVPFSPKSHLYSCSLCGQWADRHWNYCPNCGARMDEE